MVAKLQAKLKDYIDIIQKVARVEYRRIPSHMLDCEELISIGIIALQALFKNKTEEQLENYNSSYIATAGYICPPVPPPEINIFLVIYRPLYFLS